jgi:hypothetical protein
VSTRWQGGIATGVVLLATAAFVVLDLTDAAVRRWGTAHTITVDTLCGVLVVLITVLVVNQVLARRTLEQRASAIAAQAAILLSQAVRTVRAVRAALGDAEELESAREEMRSYATMLLIAAPVLIDAARARAFLEQGQALAGELARILGDLREESADRAAATARLDGAVSSLRAAAAPLMAVLTPDQRSAVTSGP